MSATLRPLSPGLSLYTQANYAIFIDAFHFLFIAATSEIALHAIVTVVAFVLVLAVTVSIVNAWRRSGQSLFFMPRTQGIPTQSSKSELSHKDRIDLPVKKAVIGVGAFDGHTEKGKCSLTLCMNNNDIVMPQSILELEGILAQSPVEPSPVDQLSADPYVAE